MYCSMTKCGSLFSKLFQTNRHVWRFIFKLFCCGTSHFSMFHEFPQEFVTIVFSLDLICALTLCIFIWFSVYAVCDRQLWLTLYNTQYVIVLTQTRLLQIWTCHWMKKNKIYLKCILCTWLGTLFSVFMVEGFRLLNNFPFANILSSVKKAIKNPKAF